MVIKPIYLPNIIFYCYGTSQALRARSVCQRDNNQNKSVSWIRLFMIHVEIIINIKP